MQKTLQVNSYDNKREQALCDTYRPSQIYLHGEKEDIFFDIFEQVTTTSGLNLVLDFDRG